MRSAAVLLAVAALFRAGAAFDNVLLWGRASREIVLPSRPVSPDELAGLLTGTDARRVCVALLPTGTNLAVAIGAFDKEPQQLAQTVLSKTGFRALVAGAALNGDATAVGDALRSRERSVELVRGADVSAVLQDASSAESQALVADLSSFAASDAVDTAMVLCEEYGEESYVAVVATKSAASAPTRSLLTTVGATSSDNEYIRITPEILAGLVLSFFLILIAFTGIYYLLGIQTPSKLPTDPPTVGREY